MNKCSPFIATLTAVILTTTVPALAQASFTSPFTLEKRATAQHADRFGDLPLGAVIRTDERYGRDALFQGPRGWDYWNLLGNPKPDQDPHLCPARRPAYFIAQLKMPPGAD